jgi:hypothetical protein
MIRAPNFSLREWKHSKMNVTEEYYWAVRFQFVGVWIWLDTILYRLHKCIFKFDLRKNRLAPDLPECYCCVSRRVFVWLHCVLYISRLKLNKFSSVVPSISWILFWVLFCILVPSRRIASSWLNVWCFVWTNVRLFFWVRIFKYKLNMFYTYDAND